jgi:hypothetical protein
MPQRNIFQWRAGNGWLVLSGGGNWDTQDVTGIEANVLTHTVSQGPIAYVWAAGDVETADRHMDSLRDLGARTGYLVDILSEGEDDLFRQLSEAGVIILGDGARGEILRDAMAGVVLRSIEMAFSQGATLYTVGMSVPMLGARVFYSDSWSAGFGWLAQSVIMPGYTTEQADRLRDWVQAYPEGYGLGLGEGAALALGPQGEVEVWGNGAITVSLGQLFRPGA